MISNDNINNIHVHKLYLYVGNGLLPVLVYEYNKRNNDGLIIQVQEAEHHIYFVPRSYVWAWGP
jgi:hypothetical protein